MTFWQIFLRVLPSRPLPAIGALYWYMTGRRLRARNRLRAAGVGLAFVYDCWIRSNERPDQMEDRFALTISNGAWRPRFCVIVLAHAPCTPEELERTVRSIRRQSYPHYVLCVASSPTEASTIELDTQDRGGNWAAGLTAATNDFVVLVRPGDELSSFALFYFAEALQSDPEATLIYGDHDELDSRGRRTNPWFKPRWNEELFLAQDYLSGAVAIRTEAVREVAAQVPAVSGEYELLLRVAGNAAGSILHVPHIVAHLNSKERSNEQELRIQAIERHLGEMGAAVAPGPFATVKISWPLPSELPLVSIIIPTKDKVELLRACVEGVLAQTSYRPFEILVVDNGSVEKSTAEYLAELRRRPHVRVLLYPGTYNFSAINNFAAREAAGSFLCLLNNDTEVVEDGWLTEMMRYAVRSQIGAVGAKLLYADNTIQHAGVIVGIGEAAGHAHRNLPTRDKGYFGRAHSAHFVSAVTGACLLVEKQKFLGVGGLDQDSFAVAYNDIDFCLKLERAGWRNVYVPHAVLIHHESKSRGKDHARSQIDRYRKELTVFQKRWGSKTYDDPLFNPNLDRSNETFVIRL